MSFFRARCALIAAIASVACGTHSERETPTETTSSPTLPSTCAPPHATPFGSRTFAVAAKTYGTSPGLYVEAGARVQVSASGTWTVAANSVAAGPEGYASELDGCPFASLVARVGLGYGVPPICVGAGTTFEAPRSGLVYFGVDDYVLEDNDGSLDVTVTSASAESRAVASDAVTTYDPCASAARDVELESHHVILAVPNELVRKHQSTAAEALAAFDGWYERELELGGTAPYGGHRIRFVADPGVAALGAWMLAGNPIRVDPRALDAPAPESSFLEAADPALSVWGAIHELGHDFSYANGGRFMIGAGPVEGWANVFTLYVVERENRPERNRAICDEAQTYLASGTYEQLTTNGWISLCMLMELKSRFGWDLFARFFRLETADMSDVGSSDRARWTWVRGLLNAAAGADTTPVLEKYRIPLDPL